MERVTTSDLPKVRALLMRKPHLAMFPLANLDRYGLDGNADRAVSMWWDGENVLAVTREGMIFPVLSDVAAMAAAHCIADRLTIGIIGEARGSRALQQAANLHGPAMLDRNEPQYLLDMGDLKVPDGPGELVPLVDAPRTLMEEWRIAYDVEVLGDDPVEARNQIPAEVQGYIDADSHRVLMVNGAPVCTTGFNATLPQIVQVGGVYTPPDLRRKGYARRAVALHLAEARAKNVSQATLFAASEDAGRVYTSIGFRPCGDWTMLLFDGPQRADG